MAISEKLGKPLSRRFFVQEAAKTVVGLPAVGIASRLPDLGSQPILPPHLNPPSKDSAIGSNVGIESAEQVLASRNIGAVVFIESNGKVGAQYAVSEGGIISRADVKSGQVGEYSTVAQVPIERPNQVAVSPDQKRIVVAGRNFDSADSSKSKPAVFLSSDKGTNFVEVDTGLSRDYDPTIFSVDGTESYVVFAKKNRIAGSDSNAPYRLATMDQNGTISPISIPENLFSSVESVKPIKNQPGKVEVWGIGDVMAGMSRAVIDMRTQQVISSEIVSRAPGIDAMDVVADTDGTAVGIVGITARGELLKRAVGGNDEIYPLRDILNTQLRLMYLDGNNTAVIADGAVKVVGNTVWISGLRYNDATQQDYPLMASISLDGNPNTLQVMALQQQSMRTPNAIPRRAFESDGLKTGMVTSNEKVAGIFEGYIAEIPVDANGNASGPISYPVRGL